MFSNRPAMKRDYKPREEGDSFGSEGMEGIRENLYFIRDSVQRRILAEFEGEVNQENHEQLRQMIEVFFNQLLVEENLLYTRANRQRILDWVVADIIGYGPLEPLLNDDDITEIMVNGYNKVYIERHGRIETTKTTFEDETHLRRIIDRIVAPIGRRVDESSPMVDARLPSGFRVNATIPPLSLEGPLLTIRKFATVPYTAQDLISNGTLNAHLVGFLQACVQARINMVISGGTGSGKTTLLNLVSAFIPETERVITIEDIAELRLVQDHVIRLEKKPPNIEGRGEVTIRQLVVNALRMRPDRIIVGESSCGFYDNDPLQQSSRLITQN
jgi:pilus assembly protein CpaF